MTREGRLQFGDDVISVDKALLDTGANSGNYISQSLVDRLPSAEIQPCTHKVLLGDGTTLVHIERCVTLDVRLYDDQLCLSEPISTEFYIMPQLEGIIIGLPEILGNYYDIFVSVLQHAHAQRPAVRVERLFQLYDLCKAELCSPDPSRKRLKAWGNEARAIGSWYNKHKCRIRQDCHHQLDDRSAHDGTTFTLICSSKYGSAFADETVEQLAEIIQQLKDFPIGEILDAWSNPFDECPEEAETQDPLAFGRHWLRYMEVPVEQSRDEYRELLKTNISPEMLAAQPRVMDIMLSAAAVECFAPSKWSR